LPALAEHHLRELGVTRIYRSDQCTVSSPDDFFSYRREGITGRMANLIWIID
jgi:copper oxidase (laccase) domain-containing protein